MWEEDPRWQRINFRATICLGIFAVTASIFLGLWLNDWSPFEAILGALAIMFAALCVYAGLVWTIGNSIKLLWRLTGRFRRERDAGKLTDH
jgi:hypothetical protein